MLIPLIRLSILLLCLCFWFVPVMPSLAEPHPPSLLLAVEDLPSGFMQVPATEVAGCQPQGDQGELAAFVLQRGQATEEAICMSAFWITAQAANQAQANLMRQMIDTLLDNPQAMIEQTAPGTTTGVEVLPDLPAIGDAVMGFAKPEANQRIETILFRRGDVLASIAVHYQNAVPPAVAATTIATQLDRHLLPLANSEGTA